MIKLSERCKFLKPSPTLALVSKAKELEAQGFDVISLALGEPDWDTIAPAKESGLRAINEGKTKYTPASGLLELRKAIVDQTNQDLGTSYKINEVSVASGAKYSIFAALQVLCDPGDEVIVPEPYWVSYPTMIELTGAKPVIAKCSDHFKLTPSLLESSITPKTKALFLNSPSNPTGIVYDQKELRALAEVLLKFPKIVVLSDDIYNRLMFDTDLAPHILHDSTALVERTIIFNGVSKSYSMTGWRIGWSIGPEEVIRMIADYQSQSTGSPSSISQLASYKAILEGEQHVKQARSLLKSRRDFALKEIKSIPDLEVTPPQGAFYLWLNIKKYLNRNYKNKIVSSSRDLCALLLEEEKVATVPGIEFGIEGFMRLSFALEQERMGQALLRLKRFLQSFSK